MSEGQTSLDKILLKAIIDSPDDLIILAIDMEYNYIAFNRYHYDVMLRAYGKQVEPGMNILECITSTDDVKKSMLNYGRAIKGESHTTVEEFGEIDRQYYETRYSPIYNENKAIIGATAFSSNVTEHKLMENALILSESRYKELIELAPDGILIGNKDGVITEANSSLLKITGRSSDEIIGKNISSLFADDEVYRTPLRYDLLNEGKTVTRERVVMRPDSTLANIEMHTKMMPDGSYQSIWHDITRKKHDEILLKEQSSSLSAELKNRRKSEEILQKSLKQLEISKHASLNLLEDIKQEMEHRIRAEDEIREMNIILEQRVAERTTQLESANSELEAFAYSVSHDLRAPLRAIDGFSKFLMEDYGTKLDAEGHRLLKLIRSNTKKMDRLIIDILALSRVSRNLLKKSKVDMTKMAISMLNEVAPPENIKNLNIVIGKLPTAFADSIYLKQVWVNLISNAIKFSSEEAKPKIEFGGYDDKGYLVYYVKDNGVGFNQDFAHKLFGVFQRLHKTDEFEGNGVGLAIVQRIIHRHGGNVWAEGKVGHGATFYFSLPAGD